MKKLAAAGLIILVSPLLLAAQSVVSVSPEKPVIGETAIVSYDLASPDTKFDSCENLYMVERNALTWKDFDQFETRKVGTRCQAAFPIYPRTNYVVFYFRQGDRSDQNDGTFWDLLAYDSDGSPAKSAYVYKSFSRTNLPLPAEEIERLQREDNRNEALAHPDDLIAQARYWEILLKQGADPDSLFTACAPILAAYWEENGPSQSAYSSLSYAYRQLQRPQEVEKIRADVLTQFPEGEMAQQSTFQEISRIQDVTERVEQLDEYFSRFPDSAESLASYYLRNVYLAYKDAGRIQDMKIWAGKYVDAETYSPSRAARTLALDLLEVGEKEDALQYAEWALANESRDLINSFYRVIDDSTWIPTSLYPDVRERAERHRNAENRLVLGKVLYALGEYEAALEQFSVASRHIVDNVEVFHRLAEAQRASGNLQAAYAGYFDLASRFPEDGAVLDSLRSVYETLHGFSDGYSEVLADLQAIWDAKPHPVFSVDDYYIENDPFEDLTNTIEMATERGKRIMLFVGGEWCTWCHALTRYFKQTDSVARVLQENYIIMKVNYSTENPNEEFLSQYPPISGYPYLFILESDGTFLHPQDTGSLEQGVGMAYYEDVVLTFLNEWKPRNSSSTPE